MEAIPSGLSTLLQKMEFIAMVPKNKKMCVNSKLFVDSSSWMDALYRGVSRETKQGTLKFIEETIQEGIRGISGYPGHTVLIISAFERMLTGMDNLSETYKNYPEIVSSLSVFKTDISIQISNFKQANSSHDLDQAVSNVRRLQMHIRETVLISSDDYADEQYRIE